MYAEGGRASLGKLMSAVKVDGLRRGDVKGAMLGLASLSTLQNYRRFQGVSVCPCGNTICGCSTEAWQTKVR